MNEKYCYSWNEENYYGSFDTELEAIGDAKGDRPDAEWVFIGTCQEPELKWSSNEEEIIESILENLEDEVGEASENFEISIPDEIILAKMIDETVAMWIEENNIKPSCYKVIDGHKVDLI